MSGKKNGTEEENVLGGQNTPPALQMNLSKLLRKSPG